MCFIFCTGYGRCLYCSLLIDLILTPLSLLRSYANTSNASDDDLLHITHAGSVSELPAPSDMMDEEPYSHYYNADDNIPGIGQYDDFHTIDWQRDIARDRMRHR